MLLLLPVGGVQTEADADSMISRKEAGCLELPIHPAMRHHKRRAVWDGGSHIAPSNSKLSAAGWQVLRKGQGNR
jgi:hypothetical protein